MTERQKWDDELKQFVHQIIMENFKYEYALNEGIEVFQMINGRKELIANTVINAQELINKHLDTLTNFRLSRNSKDLLGDEREMVIHKQISESLNLLGNRLQD